MTATLLLREGAATYGRGRDRLAEADLWRLWEGQSFPRRALVTAGGQSLRVVFRGRPGIGPGPDFRDAVLAAPHGLVKGDVELHVRTSDWRRHGHGLDPSYAEVALHVVFFHDEPEPETVVPGGGLAPVVALGGPRTGDWLALPPKWGEPCREAVPRLGTDGVAAALDRLGAMRFRQKIHAWKKRLAAHPAEEALWCGVLEGLAYGGEREAFACLGTALSWGELRSRLLALPVGQRAPQARTLLARAYELIARPARRSVRPGNGPQKRLEGAAALAARFAGPGLAASLVGPLEEPEEAVPGLVAALTVPRLVGRARAIEIAGNAVLPLAGALCGEPAVSRIEAAFGQLPQPARYGAVRHLHAASPGVAPSMRRQQGMLYLLRQYCTQGGCGRCPLS